MQVFRGELNKTNIDGLEYDFGLELYTENELETFVMCEIRRACVRVAK